MAATLPPAAPPGGALPANDLPARLGLAAASLGIRLSEAQSNQLIAYLASLQRWNAVYNLTSVREPEQMLQLHLVDCLALLGPLRRHVGQAGRARLLDVGSGAGLPGVVIAILAPDVSVTCIDAVGKKAAFVRQVAAELRLPNLTSTHGRVERLEAAPFDLVLSRAFASLAGFIRLTHRQLAPTGAWLAMKGKVPHQELAEVPAHIEVFHVEPLVVPGLAAQRCLVWMRPKP